MVAYVDVGDVRRRVLRPQAVHEGAAGDAEEPGAEPGAVAQSMDAAQDAQPDVLRDLVRRVVAAGQAPGVLPERRVPAVDELVERLAFAELAADDEQLVFAGVQVCCRCRSRVCVSVHLGSRGEGRKVHGFRQGAGNTEGGVGGTGREVSRGG